MLLVAAFELVAQGLIERRVGALGSNQDRNRNTEGLTGFNQGKIENRPRGTKLAIIDRITGVAHRSLMLPSRHAVSGFISTVSSAKAVMCRREFPQLSQPSPDSGSGERLPAVLAWAHAEPVAEAPRKMCLTAEPAAIGDRAELEM